MGALWKWTFGVSKKFFLDCWWSFINFEWSLIDSGIDVVENKGRVGCTNAFWSNFVLLSPYHDIISNFLPSKLNPHFIILQDKDFYAEFTFSKPWKPNKNTIIQSIATPKRLFKCFFACVFYPPQLISNFRGFFRWICFWFFWGIYTCWKRKFDWLFENEIFSFGILWIGFWKIKGKWIKCCLKISRRLF